MAGAIPRINQDQQKTFFIAPLVSDIAHPRKLYEQRLRADAVFLGKFGDLFVINCIDPRPDRQLPLKKCSSPRSPWRPFPRLTSGCEAGAEIRYGLYAAGHTRATESAPIHDQS